MTRMKLHDSAASQSFPLKIHPTLAGEHLGDEILAQPGIVQAPFFFHGQIRKGFHKSGSEKTAAFAIQKAGSAVYLDTLETTTWRASLQHVAAESLIDELSDFLLRPVVHLFGVIESRTGRYKTQALGVRPQAEAIPGGRPRPISNSGQTGTHSTYRPKLTDQEFILFVAAVKTHLLTEKTGRDPDANT